MTPKGAPRLTPETGTSSVESIRQEQPEGQEKTAEYIGGIAKAAPKLFMSIVEPAKAAAKRTGAGGVIYCGLGICEIACVATGK